MPSTNSQVRTGAFSPDGSKVASGSEDKTTKLWDVATHSCLNTFYEHSDVVTSVAFHPSIVCRCQLWLDKTIKIWDTDPTRLYSTTMRTRLL